MKAQGKAEVRVCVYHVAALQLTIATPHPTALLIVAVFVMVFMAVTLSLFLLLFDLEHAPVCGQGLTEGAGLNSRTDKEQPYRKNSSSSKQ